VKGRSSADIAIPVGHIRPAMDDLMAHVRLIHEASMFLYCESRHAPAAYFAILCLEEMSKCLVLALRLGRGEGVTVGDMGGMRSHEGKTLSLLLRLRGAPSQASPNCSLVAAMLESIKQLVVQRVLYD